MPYDPKRVKKQIQAEIDLYKKFTPAMIWNFLINEVFNNDVKSAKKFMLSKDGGFQKQEVEEIIRNKNAHKQTYTRKLNCGMELSS